MSKGVKCLLMIGPMLFGFVMSLTTPVVQIYFIKHVDPSIFAISGVLATGLAAAVQSITSNEKMRLKICRWFYWILVFDCIAFTVISFAGLESVTTRFIGIAILSAVSVNLWMVIMKDSLNNILSGAALTDFQSLSTASYLWANLVGGILSVILINRITIDLAIGAQCIANAFCAVSDWMAYKKINSSIEVIIGRAR